MAATGKRNIPGAKKNPRAVRPDVEPHELSAETSFDASVSGIPGTAADVGVMMGRDGKWLNGKVLPSYATGRADRQAPPFPGLAGGLSGGLRKNHD